MAPTSKLSRNPWVSLSKISPRRQTLRSKSRMSSQRLAVSSSTGRARRPARTNVAAKGRTSSAAAMRKREMAKTPGMATSKVCSILMAAPSQPSSSGRTLGERLQGCRPANRSIAPCARVG